MPCAAMRSVNGSTLQADQSLEEFSGSTRAEQHSSQHRPDRVFDFGHALVTLVECVRDMLVALSADGLVRLQLGFGCRDHVAHYSPACCKTSGIGGDVSGGGTGTSGSSTGGGALRISATC